MNSSFYQWLVEVEDSLLRMIRGVFRFVVEGLPTWIYRVVVEMVGPLAVRLSRVAGLACLWLVILFGPIAFTCNCGLHGWWTLFSAGWISVAIVGSLWGLHRAVTKRKEIVGRAAR
jgi:hypothetical protein